MSMTRTLARWLVPVVLVARVSHAQAADSLQFAGSPDTRSGPHAIATPASKAPPAGPFVGAGVGFRNELFSGSTPFRVGLGAVSDQIRWQPMAWGGTTTDFGARAGVRLAEVGAHLTVLYGVAALLDQDATYRPRYHGSFVARAGHALLGSVTAYNRRGDRVFAPGTFAGALAMGATARALLPGDTPRAEIASRAMSGLTGRVVRMLWIEFLTRPRR